MRDAVRHAHVGPVLTLPSRAVSGTGRGTQGGHRRALGGDGRDDGGPFAHHLRLGGIPPRLQEGRRVGHGVDRFSQDHPPAIRAEAVHLGELWVKRLGEAFLHAATWRFGLPVLGGGRRWLVGADGTDVRTRLGGTSSQKLLLSGVELRGEVSNSACPLLQLPGQHSQLVALHL